MIGRTRTSRYLAVAATLLLLTNFAFAQANSAGKLLRWKLNPGEAIRVSFNQDMTMSTNMMGNELKSGADMGMVLRWDVAQVAPNGVLAIRQQIERLTMRMESPGGGGPIRYDSAAGGELTGMNKALASSMEPLIGVQFDQQMTNRGEILDVKLTPDAQAKLAKQPTGAQLKEMFSKEGMKSLLHQAATVLPEKPVKPGDSWKGTTETKSPVGKLVMDMTYTYRGTVMDSGRPLERIDVGMMVRFAKQANEMGLNVSVKEQKNAGALFFDAELGRFVRTEMRQTMTLVTSIGPKEHQQSLDTMLTMKFANANSPAAKTASRTPAAVR